MQSQEIAQEFGAFHREKALGMKLHAVDWQLPVTQPHDLALRGPGTYFEDRFVDALSIDDETVIASCRKGICQAGDDSAAIMVDQ